MHNSDRFAGKVAVITGGTSGIGRAIVDQFVREGGRIVIGARNPEPFEAIVNEIGSDKVYCQVCDQSVRAQVDALIQAAYDKFGALDVVFGNAGINLFQDFLEVSEEDHDKIIKNNYYGAFNVTQAAGRAFVAHGTPGAIVNTASINCRVACPNSTPYAASKGAIKMMSQGAAVELAQYGIRVNCVAPGSTDTPMVKDSARERFPTYTAPKLILPRQASPAEPAAVACFLASDEASYVTGEIYYCVGGWGLK